MPDSPNRAFEQFLEETAPLTAAADELPYEAAAELYGLYGEFSSLASKQIKSIDPEIRVRLCGVWDELLERIADVYDFSKNPPLKPKGVYTPAAESYRRWHGAELMKDKGLAGYTLSKELNARCVMYFASEREDYPYADALPGLELLRDGSESGIADVYNEHLLANYPDMDVLALHGPYPQTMDYLNNYRKLRPDGKVYCGLDMNSLWAEDYPWEHEYATRLFSQCDVIATSCRHTRDALNRDPRVSFPCRWFPNGFYNVTGKRAEADAERKENVIITVGRIGNKYKNNEELMVAYARASNELDGWTLKFIGPVETKIEPFKAHYFKERPDLKDRVVFTGAINDKDELYGEYAKAKIFALTSTKEGGPNVYAEALFHGCMFITSDIDAADDMTNYGQLGKKYKLGDPDELADTLIEMCNKADKKAFEKHIPKALKYADRYYDWNRNAKKLRYMLYRG